MVAWLRRLLMIACLTPLLLSAIYFLGYRLPLGPWSLPLLDIKTLAGCGFGLIFLLVAEQGGGEWRTFLGWFVISGLLVAVIFALVAGNFDPFALLSR